MPPLHQHPSTTTDAPDVASVRRHAGHGARRTGAAAIAALVALAVGGCGGGSSSSPSAGPSSNGPSTGTPPVTTVVSIDKVAGTVHKPNRQRFHHQPAHLRAEVGQAVDAWFDGGFVGVDYPTTDFPDAFTTFTAQAKSDATRQKALMTTGKLGAHIDGVTTLKRTVTLDVLAPEGQGGRRDGAVRPALPHERRRHEEGDGERTPVPHAEPRRCVADLRVRRGEGSQVMRRRIGRVTRLVSLALVLGVVALAIPDSR